MSWRAAFLLLLASPSLADAQGLPGSRPIRRLEIAVGAGLLGGSALGVRDADLRANSTTPEPFRLFSTENTFAAAPVFDVRAGFALTRRYGVEGGLSVSRPGLVSSVADDVEEAPSLVIEERIDQYFADAGVVVAIEELRLGPLLPVISGGAGYLRQLHDGRTLVEEGFFVHAGFGVRHWLAIGGTGLLKGTGLRADARLYVLDGGITVEGEPRPQGSISGSFFVVF